MRAIVSRNGSLATEVFDDPFPGEGEVVVKVAAAGVNRADVLQAQGNYPPPPGASEILGLEVAGTVASVGKEVTEFIVGDRVMALLQGGGYAEYVRVAQELLMPVPQNISLEAAAGIPEVAATVWTNLFDTGSLVAGETVLIHGGSGGIGSMAIQLARQNNNRVITTAGSVDGCQKCLEIGADVAINYRTQDVEREVAEATENNGVDVILDILGGGALNSNIGMLGMDGRVVIIGTQLGREGNLQLGPLMRKRGSIHATTLRARSLEERGTIIAAVRERILPLLIEESVTPVIHSTYPLEEAAKAHAKLGDSSVFGKLILIP